MKEKPYIGVTGAASQEEVNHLVSTFESNNINPNSLHQPMIGILVSYKTLNGQETENRRYPAFSQVKNLLIEANGRAFNTIHYNSRRTEDLADQINSLLGNGIYAEDLCSGVQLNITWPPTKELVVTKRRFPDLKLILSVTNEAITNSTPYEVGKLLRRYGNLASYALIDPSAGRGLVFELDELAAYHYEIMDQNHNLSIGFAGGFTPDNLERRCKTISDLISSDDFSIDSERGVRTMLSPKYGDDLYNREKVEKYINVAGSVFNS